MRTVRPVMPEQCKSCIFRTDGNQLPLPARKFEQIKDYLVRGKNHNCHAPQLARKTPKLICRGGRNYQLTMLHRMGLIEEPTDQALEEAMREVGVID